MLDHHVLGDRVVEDGFLGEILAEPGLLEAAVGRLRGEGNVVVDPHRSELERARDPEGPADVLGPDRGRQPVENVVAQPDRLVLALEGQHHQHRAEDLLLHDLGPLVDVGDDRRRRRSSPAPCPPAPAPPVTTLAPSARARSTKPATRSRWVEEISGPMKVSSLQGSPTLVDSKISTRASTTSPIRSFGCVQPGGGGAVLAGVEQRSDLGRGGHGLEIGILEDDERGLAAQLQVNSLEGVGGGLHHLLAGSGRAGQRDHPQVGMFDQCLAGVVAAGDHVEYSVGDAGLLGQFPEHEGGPGSAGGGLQHRGASGRQGRPDLPDRHGQRIVPGGDLADRTHRLASEHRGVTGHEVARSRPGDVASRGGEEAEVVDRHRQVGPEGAPGIGLAGVLRLDPGELLGAGLQHVRQAVDGQGPGPRAQLRPAPVEEGGVGGSDRLVDIGGGCRRRRCRPFRPVAGFSTLSSPPPCESRPAAVYPELVAHSDSCLRWISDRQPANARRRVGQTAG